MISTHSYRSFLVRYPLDPREKSPKRQRVLLIATLLALLAAAVFLGCMSLAFATLYVKWVRIKSYFQLPFLAFLNILPAVLLTFFLYGLTNRAWLAYALSALIVMGGTFANFFKVVLRNECAVFEDLFNLGAAAGILGEYDISLSMPFYIAILLCLVTTALLFVLCRGRLPQWRWRLGSAVLAAALALGAFQLWYRDDALYKSFSNDEWFNQWQPTEYYASRGFLYPFFHSYDDAFPSPPAGYTKAKAQAIRAEYPDRDLETKVNFVAVMLESFTELELDYVQDPYGPWEALKAESLSGTLLSDTMGGGTINAERSFLTGFAYPQPAYSHATESFVWYFQDQGYATEGCHPGHDWFYNRQNINQNLGFARYFFSENLFADRTDREYAGDDVFFETVRQLYEAAEGPYFSFSVSYQGHSPYASDSLVWGTEYVARDGLSEENYYTVNNYLGGVADTVTQISRFVDSFREDSEPVVLVFFGDHRPTLGASNSAYGELGIVQDRATLTGFSNFYATPYLIWANDAAKEVLGQPFTGTGPTISPCYLMAEVFSACGLDGPGYLRLLQETMDAVPVRHSTGVYLTGGALTENLSETQEKILEKAACMEYDLRSSKRE